MVEPGSFSLMRTPLLSLSRIQSKGVDGGGHALQRFKGPRLGIDLDVGGGGRLFDAIT